MRKLIATLGLAVILLGACGGGGSNNSTNANASGSTSSTAASSSGGGGGNFSEVCGARAAFGFNPVSPGGTDLKSTLEAAHNNIEKAKGYVPTEIKADFSVLADGFNTFYVAAQASGFDMMKLAQTNSAALQSLQDPKYKAAGDRINAWVTAHCH